jgi:hypothetical protein
MDSVGESGSLIGVSGIGLSGIGLSGTENSLCGSRLSSMGFVYSRQFLRIRALGSKQPQK